MKQLLLLGAISLCTFSFAQRPVFSFEPAYIGALKTATTPDPKTKSILFVSIQKDCIERVALGSSGKEHLLHQGMLPNKAYAVNSEANPKLLSLFYYHNYVSGYRFGNKIIETVQFRQLSDVVFVETDLTTGISRSTDTLRILRKDDIIFDFTRNNELCLVEKPKNKPYFLFHSKVVGSSVKTDTVRIELPAIGRAGNDLFETKINDFSDVTMTSDVQVLPNNLWFPIHVLNYRNKAFIQRDQFYLTLNANDLTTWVIHIDLNTLATSVKKFDEQIADKQPEGLSSNSALIIDSILIRAVANKSAIHYAVHNLKSGKLLYRQTIDETNFDDNTTSPVLKVGDFWSRSNLAEVSLNEFVGKAKENQLIINGYREKDQLFLTFGSTYKRFLSATFLGNLFTLGMGNFAQVKPPSTVYFHTALQLSTLKPTKTLIKTAIWDKLLNHVFANRNTHEPLNFFYLNGFYYLGYFSIVKKEYELYRFAEKTD